MTRVWTDNGFRNVLGADPKPARRVKADQNEWVRLRKEKLGPCRICDDASASPSLGVSLHHIVSKSLRGDDVADNLVPLCGDGTRGCHGLVEARHPWARQLLGERLTEAERAYVLRKKGAGWLERHYGVREERAA